MFGHGVTLHVQSQCRGWSWPDVSVTVRGAGLGHTTALGVKDNVHTLKLTFSDPQRVIGRHRGTTQQLTGAFEL